MSPHPVREDCQEIAPELLTNVPLGKTCDPQRVLDNVREEIREEVAYALELASQPVDNPTNR